MSLMSPPISYNPVRDFNNPRPPPTKTKAWYCATRVRFYGDPFNAIRATRQKHHGLSHRRFHFRFRIEKWNDRYNLPMGIILNLMIGFNNSIQWSNYRFSLDCLSKESTLKKYILHNFIFYRAVLISPRCGRHCEEGGRGERTHTGRQTVDGVAARVTTAICQRYPVAMH